MKGLILVIAIAVSATISATVAEAAQCKVRLEDVGTIIGKGTTKELAFEDAAIQCYEKRESRLNSRRSSTSAVNGGLDEDTKLTLIDLCANVRCS